MTEAVATTEETTPIRDWESGPLYTKAVIPPDNSELCHAGIDWGIEFARVWDTTLVGNHVYAARLHDDRFRQVRHCALERIGAQLRRLWRRLRGGRARRDGGASRARRAGAQLGRVPCRLGGRIGGAAR